MYHVRYHVYNTNVTSRFASRYATDQYVWSLISGVGIFFLGCGVSVYHGISGLLLPHEIEVCILSLTLSLSLFLSLSLC